MQCGVTNALALLRQCLPQDDQADPGDRPGHEQPTAAVWVHRCAASSLLRESFRPEHAKHQRDHDGTSPKRHVAELELVQAGPE